MHADFNPKNLLVDPATGGVTGVLDWEFAYAGAPLGDLGNLLRFETDPVFAAAAAGTYTDRAPDVPPDWLEVARALDLYALLDLAGGDQLPLMMLGAFSFGQYSRIISMNLLAGAGSQFDSLSAPGDSFWK